MEQKTQEIKPRGRGRPKKGELIEKKTKNKGVLGRPKGESNN
jgi:hypothetical protein